MGFQFAHDAVSGRQAEGGPAREHDGVDALNGIVRLQEIGLARTGPAAAHIHAG